MPKDMRPFKQDIRLVSETERRVRQAAQYTHLPSAISAVPDEDVWEWETSGLDGAKITDKRLDEQYTSVWESFSKVCD